MTEMFHLLLTLVLSEVAVILILLFGSPLRNLVILIMNKMKRGRRGPVVAKTVAATMLLVFSSTLFSITKIQKRKFESGVINSTDEVLMANNLLDACLIGFCLLLAVIIDRLHHYICKLHQLRNNLEGIKNLHQLEDEHIKTQMTDKKDHSSIQNGSQKLV